MFVSLDDTQIETKLDFIDNFVDARNSADGSLFDSNANVASKNIAVLETELNKDVTIQINRALVKRKVKELYGEDLSDEYIRQIEDHEIYVHDESSCKPYCASVSLYPFLLHGLKSLGGESGAPKHLESFCGSFVNLIFALASQFAGAVASVETLMVFDYFARKDYGEDYLKTHEREIKNHLQHIIYCINQPAAARGFQSVFFNITLFDKYYFDAMFGDSFVFPDMSKPDWNSLERLQRFFLRWFNKERENAVLTYPIVTAAMLTHPETKQPRDRFFAKFLAKEMSEGNSFFIYLSQNADSLSSCCRLRNELSDINDFSYSLGAGGVATGSVNVITLNLNRLVQKGIRNKGWLHELETTVDNVHKYHKAYRVLLKEFEDKGMLPVYTAGFVTPEKQFSTIGINGLVEAAEFLGIHPRADNEQYKVFVDNVLKLISDKNKETDFKCNTELVPAENLGVKNANWDRKDGYLVPRDCYNSYFYPVEDESLTIPEKFELHGDKFVRFLDGGSALHLNLNEALSEEQYLRLIDLAIAKQCNYFCVNVKSTVCNECGFISKKTLDFCVRCGSENIDHATRIIGYLKKISSFSSKRSEEESRRYYYDAKDKSILE